jgi:hypothetical protein
MRLQRKPERWMCLVTSFAMALDIPVAEIIREIGHDGSQILWPALPEPMCRRGFHPQELIDVCRARGYAVTNIEACPGLMATAGRGPEFRWLTEDEAWSRFTRVTESTRGVLEGVVLPRKHHAVAYERGRLFDPDGHELSFSRDACAQRSFMAQHLWCLDRIGGAA